jgi:AcrR family transcriptional regulator
LSLLWGLPAPARRGPKPGHTVPKIVEAARGLADEEGFAAVSLPKVARRLGLTANALYRYVNSRDELLLLLVDSGTGAPPDDIVDHPRWRDGVAAWVHALIDRYRARPWLLQIPVRGAPVTPNLLRWLESLLTVLDRSGLAARDHLSCAVLIDGYVRSMATLITDFSNTTPLRAAEMTEFLYPRLSDRGFPILAGILARGTYEDGPVDIDFGLDRILDGIEVRIAATG